MIAVVDYGVGNVRAFLNAYKRLNVEARAASTPDDLRGADRILLPGVGHFDQAMRRLNESGLRATLDELVLEKRSEVIGICVGMQMLAGRSDEGSLPGLGWIDADVKIFDEQTFTGRTHLPHMGWNDVTPKRADGLFAGLGSGARFYFLHSYYFAPRHDADTLATTDYNGPFVSSVQCGNVYGVQFHPEKSHQWGIRLLKNFAEL